MTFTKQEAAEAVANLKGFMAQGDTVYCITKSISRSGMSRKVALVPVKIHGGLVVMHTAEEYARLWAGVDREAAMLHDAPLSTGDNTLVEDPPTTQEDS